ncbi:Ldh family oxidoreductase [Paenibacillus sp. GCM10012303]|uniref:Ldh family oxidoreductase n=1 Tax=Paenibacillus sp. GCM10012303 TaxID=3317340 RepID=UPI00361FA3A7
MENVKTVPILVEEMSSWSREVLGKWVEDDYVVETWTEIALNLDLIGDFTRGNARLESIVERIQNGQISRRLEVTTEQITPISARIYSTYRNWPDEVARKGAVLASSIADTYGIGIVAVPKPNIIGEGLRPVLAAGQIGLIITQNNPLLNMRISDENRIGNNPFAICAPGEPPFLFDGSFCSYSRHSMISLKEHADRYGTLPLGTILDANGEPTQDTEILYGLLKADRGNGSFAPLGGLKGLHMAMGMEFLSGALTGGFFGNAPGKPWGEGAVILAFSSKLFKVDEMKEQIQAYLNAFRTYPGKHSFEQRREMMERGWIEYPIEVYETFCRVSEKSGVSKLTISDSTM